MQNLHNILDQMAGLQPQSISSETTTSGEIIDLQDASTVELSVVAGAVTDGLFDCVINESDDSGMSGAVAVDSARVVGNGYNTATAIATGETYSFGLVDIQKRYIQLDVVTTSLATGGIVGAVASLGRLRASKADAKNPS